MALRPDLAIGLPFRFVTPHQARRLGDSATATMPE